MIQDVKYSLYAFELSLRDLKIDKTISLVCKL